ncbi:MAG TPA: beta-propeller fold lactonase family protein [Candidatus Sulfotelmatobacter sp.]|nr:beta-propeller fold lactonase family protein [Candidatus Sulfotelmatobacter sp.]
MSARNMTVGPSPFRSKPTTPVCPVQGDSDWSGRFIYVVNRDSDTVSGFMINQATGTLTHMSSPTFATGNKPVAILTTGQSSGRRQLGRRAQGKPLLPFTLSQMSVPKNGDLAGINEMILFHSISHVTVSTDAGLTFLARAGGDRSRAGEGGSSFPWQRGCAAILGLAAGIHVGRW